MANVWSWVGPQGVLEPSLEVVVRDVSDGSEVARTLDYLLVLPGMTIVHVSSLADLPAYVREAGEAVGLLLLQAPLVPRERLVAAVQVMNVFAEALLASALKEGEQDAGQVVGL